MINPDGVFNGNDRCSMVGADLNRVWNDISEFSHPTISAALDAIRRIDNDPDASLEFVFDLHSHCNLLGTFLYGNSYDDFLRFERHLLFGKIYAQTVEDFSMSNCMYNKDTLKMGTARRFLSQAVKDHVNVYSHFVSMLGFQLPNSSDILLYNEDGYQRAGRNLGRALFEYYKMLGQIPGDYIQSLQPVTGRKKTELTCAYRGMRSRTNMGKHRDEEVFHRANPLILQIEPCLQNSSYRPLVRGIHIKDTIESRPITANSSGQGSSSTAMNSEEAKETSIPSLSVIDFSSLTMTRKELRHIQRRKPASLI